MKRGKFIVIDGGDGSGKATQAKLLIKALRRQGKKVKYIDFPRYSAFYGALVGRYLTGEFGPHRDISPYLISLAYAADRAQIAPTLHAWIRKGYWIVSNRYTSANFAHQGSKFATPAQRRAYWTWLDELEYTQGNLPREDMVLYLDVPPRVSQTLLDKKNARTYLGTQQKDTAEMDVAHQEATRRVYHTLAKTRLGWHRLVCVNRKGQLLTVEEIHTQIIALVSP